MQHIISNVESGQTKIKFEEDGGIVITKSKDVSDVLNYTKERHNSGDHGSKDFKFAGSYPTIVVEHYCTQNGILMSEFLQNPAHQKRLLEDKSLSHFRIWKGKL